MSKPCCSHKPLLSSDEPAAFSAAKANDVPALRALSAADLWQRGRGGQVAAHLAAAHNCLPALAFLLNSPAAKDHKGIEVQDDKELTPLWHAVLAKKYEAVVWLVRHGANMNHLDIWGAFVVHAAAAQGSTSMVALLGHLGANLDIQDPGGHKGTPLEIAVARRHLELTEYLILQGRCPEESRLRVCAKVSSRPQDYWFRRVLQKRVGCHEAAAGGSWFCGPTFLGSCCCCGFPLRMQCGGPELVKVEHVHMSMFSGVAVLLLGARTLSEYPASDTWLAFSSVLMATATFLVYFRCIAVGPGTVPLTSATRELYARGLEAAASVTENSVGSPPWWGPVSGPMVHQLSAAGPERSKYCSALRQIVPLYDHYCTFIRGPVGRDNYPHFLGLVCSAAVTSALALRLTVASLRREPTGTTATAWCLWILLFWFAVAGVSFVLLLAVNLLNISKGITNWEMLQMNRTPPMYLFDRDTGRYSNPYDRGFRNNFADRLWPSRSCGGEFVLEADAV